MISKTGIACIFLISLTGILFSQDKVVSGDPVNFKDIGGAVVAKVGDRPVFQYNYKMQSPPKGKPAYYRRSGFIHPAYTPQGDTITEGFPQQHTHHHGIFDAWVHTTFQDHEIDFWNQQKGIGTVVFKKIVSIKEYDDYGELRTQQLHLALIDGDTIPVLEETWTIKVYRSMKPFVWDIDIRQKNIADTDLQIKQYHYGGLAFRGRDEWNTKAAMADSSDTGNFIRFKTSDGLSRLPANHTRPKWVTMYGKIHGRGLSLSVIPLTKNPDFPDTVRIHPEMPYFCFTPIVNNGFTLSPGEQFHRSYRIITSGEPVSSEVRDTIEKSY